MTWVADYSAARPGAATLIAAGAGGVMRYIAPGRNDGVQITAVELADFAAHGLPYGLVMEYSADWLEGGYGVGHADALAALAEEAALGIPRGVTYLACDFDIQPGQYAAALACLQGAADAYGGRQYVRPYGSKAFCEWVQQQWGFRGCWSTDAWSGYQTAAGSVLHQHATAPPGTPAGCDYNDLLGDWAPRTPTGDDLTPDEHNVLYTTAKAVVQLAGVVSQIQTSQNALAQSVIHGDATHYSLDQLRVDIQAIEAAVKAVPAPAPGTATDLTPVLDAIKNLKLGTVAA